MTSLSEMYRPLTKAVSEQYFKKLIGDLRVPGFPCISSVTDRIDKEDIEYVSLIQSMRDAVLEYIASRMFLKKKSVSIESIIHKALGPKTIRNIIEESADLIKRLHKERIVTA